MTLPEQQVPTVAFHDRTLAAITRIKPIPRIFLVYTRVNIRFALLCSDASAGDAIFL